MIEDSDPKAPLRAWRALISRRDDSGKPTAPTPGFVLDVGRSREPVVAELRHELPEEVRDDLRDYAIVDESGKIARKLTVTTGSDQEDLGASVFAVLDGALRNLSVTLTFSTSIRVRRSEEIVAQDLRRIPAEDYSTLSLLRRALELDAQALAEQADRQRRVAAERVQAIPGALDNHDLGVDFERAQSLLRWRVGAYNDAVERDLLGVLGRFGALRRLLVDPGGSLPAAFLAAADAFVIASRLAAFDRSVDKRHVSREIAATKFPVVAEVQARELESALDSLERNLLEKAESQEWCDALLNAAQYREAAGYVARSRELLLACL